MKKTGWIVCLLVLLSIIISLSAYSGKDSFMDKIHSNGVLRVGVKVDVPGFGHLNPATGKLEGLEIDLAGLIAKDILGDSQALKMLGVTAQTREPMLINGELDLVIATFTITKERAERFHFTEPYYQDEIGFLVRDDSELTRIMDMNGKVIGIVNSGTAYDALIAEAKLKGIELSYREFASYPEVNAALLSGKIDAFSGDKSILRGYRSEGTHIIDEGFNAQEYGIAVVKSNTEFAKYLDMFMGNIKKDGRLEEVLTRWGYELPE